MTLGLETTYKLAKALNIALNQSRTAKSPTARRLARCKASALEASEGYLRSGQTQMLLVEAKGWQAYAAEQHGIEARVALAWAEGYIEALAAL